MRGGSLPDRNACLTATPSYRARLNAERRARREAEAAVRLVSGVLDLGVDLFLAVDEGLGVVYCNDRAEAVGLVGVDGSGARVLEPGLRAELRRLAPSEDAEAPFRFIWVLGPQGIRYEVTAALKAGLLSLHFRDVTIEHRAIDELVQSERRYRELAESAFDVVALFRPDGTLVDINSSWEKISGYSREELVGTRKSLERLTPEMQERARGAAQRALRDPEPPARYELELPDKSGVLHHLEVTCRAICEEGRPPLLQLVGRDVTESRQLAERLQQSQKLEAVGRLAGGIAHDFNSILLVVREACSLLRSRIVDPGALEHLDEIQSEAERGTSLVRHLLAFARREVIEPQIVDVNEIVESLQTMLHRLVGEAIDLHARLDPEPTYVVGDRSQLEQVLVNLVINAGEAIGAVGEVWVETGTHVFPGGSSPGWGECGPGDYVTLTVRDTGVGIALELQPLIFEPFFSSHSDENTGLGLAIVYGIATQMGGGIDLASVPGEGTTFTVYLPRADAAVVPAERPAGEDVLSRPLGEQTGTILIVEDEDGPRRVLEKSVEHLGFAVLSASGAPEALELLASGDVHVDLLLTDIAMPEMNGLEFAERFRARYSGACVIYMSGYSDRISALRERLAEGDVLLEKPFSVADLAEAIRIARLRSAGAGGDRQ